MSSRASMDRAPAGYSTRWPLHRLADVCRRLPFWMRSCGSSGPSGRRGWSWAGWRWASGLVPLHKLSQWLAYSLIEPLQAAGIEVVDINGLTGLAEYRNGGLLVDTGVLQLRDWTEAQVEHGVASTLVVEWRALTVALLDRLADRVRARLGRDAASFPLAKVLQGGTWAAGRQIARARRPDGSPPIKVVSDGTVF